MQEKHNVLTRYLYGLLVFYLAWDRDGVAYTSLLLGVRRCGCHVGQHDGVLQWNVFLDRKAEAAHSGMTSNGRGAWCTGDARDIVGVLRVKLLHQFLCLFKIVCMQNLNMVLLILIDFLADKFSQAVCQFALRSGNATDAALADGIES